MSMVEISRPRVIRNALALDHLLSDMSVVIRKHELLVGSRTGKLRGAPRFPETKSFSISAQLDTYASRPIQPRDLTIVALPVNCGSIV